MIIFVLHTVTQVVSGLAWWSTGRYAKEGLDPPKCIFPRHESVESVKFSWEV